MPNAVTIHMASIMARGSQGGMPPPRSGRGALGGMVLVCKPVFLLCAAHDEARGGAGVSPRTIAVLAGCFAPSARPA
ncbi:hypothetical protein GCM10009551_018450 [Nocardiopsis tropica]